MRKFFDTIDDLRIELMKLQSGQEAGIHYGWFPEFFPPGGSDDGARAAIVAFARECSCWVRRDVDAIWFVKNDDGYQK